MGEEWVLDDNFANQDCCRYLMIALMFLKQMFLLLSPNNGDDSGILRFFKGVCMNSRPVFHAFCFI